VSPLAIGNSKTAKIQIRAMNAGSGGEKRTLNRASVLRDAAAFVAVSGIVRIRIIEAGMVPVGAVAAEHRAPLHGGCPRQDGVGPDALVPRPPPRRQALIAR